MSSPTPNPPFTLVDLMECAMSDEELFDRLRDTFDDVKQEALVLVKKYLTEHTGANKKKVVDNAFDVALDQIKRAVFNSKQMAKELSDKMSQN